MKNIKLNILKLSIIILTLSISFVSCTKDDTSEISTVENFNTLKNREAISSLLKDTKLKQSSFNKLQTEFQVQNNLSKSSDVDTVVTEDILEQFMDCSDCGGVYKDFLFPMFQEFLTIEDDNVMNRLNFYETQIENYSIDENIKANLSFLIYSLKSSAEYRLENSNKNGPSMGTSIGQGMVGGFLAGCATGAYVGATVGTVVVPVIGTVVGAVSGCFASGAVGATIGSAFGAFWNWVNN